MLKRQWCIVLLLMIFKTFFYIALNKKAKFMHFYPEPVKFQDNQRSVWLNRRNCVKFTAFVSSNAFSLAALLFHNFWIKVWSMSIALKVANIWVLVFLTLLITGRKEVSMVNITEVIVAESSSAVVTVTFYHEFQVRDHQYSRLVL